MSKVKYKFNTKSLTYEKVKVTFKQRLLQVLSYLAIGSVFAVITMLIAYRFIDSPKEKQLRREAEVMQRQKCARMPLPLLVSHPSSHHTNQPGC